MFTYLDFDFVSDPMGPVVIATSILRLILVGFLIMINFTCLFKLLRYGKFGGGIHYILHVCTFASNLWYLFTWFPFVMYGLLNGSSVFITYANYCFVQNATTNSIGYLLLAMLFVHIIEKTRIEVLSLRKWRNIEAFIAIITTWLLPQIVWFVVENGNRSGEINFNFIDDVRSVDNTSNQSVTQYKVGFMICEAELSIKAGRRLLEKHLWLVLPSAFIISFCLFALWMHKCVHKNIEVESQLCLSKLQDDKCNPGCWQMVMVDLVLYTNLAWQAVIRPLMLAETLKRMCDSSGYINFLDIGSHLILTISAVFAPTSCRTNWYSSRNAPISVSVIGNEIKHSNVIINHNTGKLIRINPFVEKENKNDI